MDNLPAVTAELAQIETLMRDNSPLYWKDADTQSRYRDLLDARQGGSGSDGDDDDDPFASGELTPVNMKEFEAAGSWASFADYARTVSLAADIVMAVPGGERRSLVDSFNRLPDAVTSAMADELGNRIGTGYAPMSDAAARAFAREKGGSLVREWGRDAQRMMGRVQGRLHRCMNQLDDRGFDVFLDWLESLTDGQTAAVYRKLAL